MTTPRLRAPHDRPGSDTGRDHRLATAVGATAAVLLVALSLLVATGVTSGLDDRVRELFRPGDQWGELQVRVDTIVEGLRPPVTAVLLGVATAVAAALRRSWWPVISVAAAGGLAVGITGVLKMGVARADTHGDLGGLGGSYPSGHVVTVLVAAGCVALLVRQRPGPWAWMLVGLVGAVMAWALLVQTAHWFTDVLGGVLVAVLVLSLAVRLPFTRDGERPAPPPPG